jgi:hypothetical protein
MDGTTSDTFIELNLNQLFDGLLRSEMSLKLKRLSAVDNDIGLNGVYYLLDSPVNGLFTINLLDGWLSLNWNVNTNKMLKASRYDLSIQARGIPQLSSKKIDFTVCISNKWEDEREIELAIPYNIDNDTVLYKFGYQKSFLVTSSDLLGYNNNFNIQNLTKEMINSSFFMKLS